MPKTGIILPKASILDDFLNGLTVTQLMAKYNIDKRTVKSALVNCPDSREVMIKAKEDLCVIADHSVIDFASDLIDKWKKLVEDEEAAGGLTPRTLTFASGGLEKLSKVIATAYGKNSLREADTQEVDDVLDLVLCRIKNAKEKING